MLPSKHWKLETVIELCAGVFVSLALGSCLLILLKAMGVDLMEGSLKWLGILLNSIFFQVAAVVLIARFLQKNDTNWGEAFGLGGPFSGRFLLVSVGAAVVFLPVGSAVMQLVAHWMERSAMAVETQQQIQMIQQAQEKSGVFVLLVHGLSVVVIAPVAEELLFRGVLYPAVKTLCRPWLAMLAVSAFFGIIHVTPVVVVPLFIFGVVLTLIYEYTGNLMAPILTHAFFNLINFIMAAGGFDLEQWLKQIFQ